MEACKRFISFPGQIKPNDKLPKHICKTCKHGLEVAYKLRNLGQANEKRFRNEIGQEEGDSDVEEQDPPPRIDKKSDKRKKQQVDAEDDDVEVEDIHDVVKVEKKEPTFDEDVYDNTELDVNAEETSIIEEGPKAKVLKLEIQQVGDDDIFIDYEELVDPEELEDGYEENAVQAEDTGDNESEGIDGQDPDDDDYVFEGDEEDDENSMNCESEEKEECGESKESDPLDAKAKVLRL